MGRVVASLAAALAALALAGCGGGGGAEPDAPVGATLVLDFQPNAVHAPLYYAKASGYFSDEGVNLDIREPSSSADSAKLLEAGRADLAILDINDFGIARRRGLDLVALAAIVQRPLASVIAIHPESASRPADLAGKTVGVTGVPSDDAVLETVLDSGGVAPDSVKRVTIGFTAVPALAAGKIDAATAFWNAEGVELRQQGVQTKEFRVDQLGAPRYPELVLAAKGDRVPDDPGLSCAVVRGLGRGYLDLDIEPQRALDAMLDQVDGLDPDAQNAQYAELIASHAFSPTDAAPPNPELTAHSTDAWASWAAAHGVIDDAGAARAGFLPGEVRHCASTPGSSPADG
jgi:putative hydroxymethylpyrimidine transport system substrate-binding protein